MGRRPPGSTRPDTLLPCTTRFRSRVVVTAGKDKGKQGDVVRVMGDKVVVSNINIVKRHTKPNPQANQPGGVIEREAPIHVANVMHFNPASGKGERIGTKVLADGRRLR